MCIINEKQEAIAQICMAIDNDKKAHLDLKSTEDIESEVKVDLESKSSKMWWMGLQEGKKMNFHIMVAGLAEADPQYCTISFNSAGPVTRDAPAEIMVSAAC